ncbi:MAG: histone deacetylase [Spirochaetes bacterium]|nr:histone deacetylase [Spirochaetota bacterium]
MICAARTTGIVFFPAFDWAISPTHPEREERLLYTYDQLAEEGIFDIDGITEAKPDVVGKEDIERVHFLFADFDRTVTPSHLVACGGAVKAARLVMEKRVEKGAALVRPPGHHAMKSVQGNRGFCAVNNEAVMLEWIRSHYGPIRTAIVDTDCHHGDGTQDIYWYDPDTLYISVHQDGRTLYPGSGFPDEKGGGRGIGKTVNIPLPPGTSEEGFLHALEHTILPILEDYKPDLVINSAGQDNHYTDPITNMRFTAQGYARLTELLNPDIVVLEGGYSIQDALPYVNLGIILALAGTDYSHVREPDYDPDSLREDGETREYIKAVCDTALREYFVPSVPLPEPGRFLEREKRIYYDTDCITEHQKESILACDSCPGVRIIKSRSSSRPLSIGVEIPMKGCERCREEGHRIAGESKKSGRYEKVLLIDRCPQG